jgi:hypothetical protein
MTNQEYNRDVKRLGKAVNKLGGSSDTEYWRKVEEEIKKEWTRLYNVDHKFEIATKNTVLTLMRINLRFRFIPLHSFGIMVEI